MIFIHGWQFSFYLEIIFYSQIYNYQLEFINQKKKNVDVNQVEGIYIWGQSWWL